VSSGQTVVFNSTTGTLKLDHAENFNGVISGLSTTDGTQAHSDQIDLTDINFSAVSLANTTYTDHGNGTGTLTLENASHQTLATLNFDGSYQLSNFTIKADVNGDTLIYDPPASPNSPVAPVVMHDPGPAATDNFTFNFKGPGQSAAGDNHPFNMPQFGQPAFANSPGGWNGVHDEGHGVIGEGLDTFTLTGVLKAHLHTADFHFV